MSTFVALIGLLSVLGFVVSITWLIIFLFLKRKAKAPLIVLCSSVVVFVIALILSPNSSSNTSENTHSVNGYTLYSVKVSKVYIDSNYNWVVKGTTSAPDGAKIVATPYSINNDNYGMLSSESKAGASWAKVQEGKFTVVVDPVGLTNATSPRSGTKTKTLIFAIKGYSKPWTSSTISKKIIKKANNFGYYNLEVNNGMANYIANLGNKNSSKSSSDNDSDSTIATLTLDGKKYNVSQSKVYKPNYSSNSWSAATVKVDKIQVLKLTKSYSYSSANDGTFNAEGFIRVHFSVSPSRDIDIYPTQGTYVYSNGEQHEADTLENWDGEIESGVTKSGWVTVPVKTLDSATSLKTIRCKFDADYNTNDYDDNNANYTYDFTINLQ